MLQIPEPGLSSFYILYSWCLCSLHEALEHSDSGSPLLVCKYRSGDIFPIFFCSAAETFLHYVYNIYTLELRMFPVPWYIVVFSLQKLLARLFTFKLNFILIRSPGRLVMSSYLLLGST